MKKTIYIHPDIDIIVAELSEIIANTITEKNPQQSTSNIELDSNGSSIFDEGELNSNSNLWDQE